jgi:hypothetical protein
MNINIPFTFHLSCTYHEKINILFLLSSLMHDNYTRIIQEIFSIVTTKATGLSKMTTGRWASLK